MVPGRCHRREIFTRQLNIDFPIKMPPGPVGTPGRADVAILEEFTEFSPEWADDLTRSLDLPIPAARWLP
jgi:hypothetical protein